MTSSHRCGEHGPRLPAVQFGFRVPVAAVATYISQPPNRPRLSFTTHVCTDIYAATPCVHASHRQLGPSAVDHQLSPSAVDHQLASNHLGYRARASDYQKSGSILGLNVPRSWRPAGIFTRWALSGWLVEVTAIPTAFEIHVLHLFRKRGGCSRKGTKGAVHGC